MQIVHYSVKINNFGGLATDGTPCVGVELTDKETGITECYPLDLALAEDWACEIIYLARSMKNKTGSD